MKNYLQITKLLLDESLNKTLDSYEYIKMKIGTIQIFNINIFLSQCVRFSNFRFFLLQVNLF